MREKTVMGLFFLMMLFIFSIGLVQAQYPFPEDKIYDYWFTNNSSINNYYGYYNTTVMSGNSEIVLINGYYYINTTQRDLNTENNYVNTHLKPTFPFTISVEVKGELNGKFIASSPTNTYADDTNGYVIDFASGQIMMCNYDNTWTNYNCLTYATSLDFTKVNNHFTFVFKNSTDMSAYVNGQLQNLVITDFYGTVDESLLNTTEVYFASEIGSNTPETTAYIKNIGYWNKALNDTEVLGLYENKNYGYITKTSSFEYSCDGTIGNPITELNDTYGVYNINDSLNFQLANGIIEYTSGYKNSGCKLTNGAYIQNFGGSPNIPFLIDERGLEDYSQCIYFYNDGIGGEISGFGQYNGDYWNLYSYNETGFYLKQQSQQTSTISSFVYSPINLGWNGVCNQFNFTSNMMTLYVNGVYADSQLFTQNELNNDSLTIQFGLFFGQNPTQTIIFDEYKFFNYSLTPTQMETLSSITPPTPPKINGFVIHNVNTKDLTNMIIALLILVITIGLGFGLWMGVRGKQTDGEYAKWLYIIVGAVVVIAMIFLTLAILYG